ncbi:MAG: hypothetical protein J0M29_04540 [Chitinophagales bacterium]|nr:hypothetical protein [Chitinophagales bacterium]
MNQNQLDEETALQHGADMLETGSSFAEVATYLRDRGIGEDTINRIIAVGSQGPLKRQLRNYSWIAGVALVVALGLFLWALNLQQEQEALIQKMIESGDSISIANAEMVLLNDPDKHLIPGRLAFACLVIGLVCGFNAFRARKTLNELKPYLG